MRFRRRAGVHPGRVVFQAPGLQIDLEPYVLFSDIWVYDSRGLRPGEATRVYDLGLVWRWRGRARCEALIAEANDQRLVTIEEDIPDEP